MTNITIMNTDEILQLIKRRYCPKDHFGEIYINIYDVVILWPIFDSPPLDRSASSQQDPPFSCDERCRTLILPPPPISSK